MMKRITALIFILCMCLSMPVYAEQKDPKEPSEIGKTQAELNGYTEEQWSLLKDNKLEYKEIRDIVHNFNPTMSQYWDAYDDSKRNVKKSVAIMNSANKDAADNYEKYKDSPYIDAATKMQLASLVTMTKTMARQYESAYDKLNRNSSSNLQLRQAEDQLVAAVQQMMIGYKTIEANAAILKELVELNEKSVKAYESMRDQGMATDADVLNAQAGLISAKSNYENLQSTKKQLYSQLITMCGWKYTDNVTIGDVPVPDKARIDAMDPAKDLEKAAGNNSTLIGLRSSSHSSSGEKDEANQAYYDAMEGNLKVKLDTLYAEVMGAWYGYEGAKAGLEVAKITENGTKQQYEMGLLSEAQYLGSMIQSLQKKAAYETAKNNLEQACVAYENAINGYCSLN